METYLKWTSQKVSELDEDVIILSNVEVIRDMTKPNGPSKGQKYIKVTWSKLSDCIIFHLQNGKCRIVQYDGKGKPFWMGEHEKAQLLSG